MPYARIVLSVVVAAALGTIVYAQPQDAQDEPADVDPARLTERYGIEPGAEQLFAAMLGSGETLPGNCTLSDGRIERTAVVATYTCSGKDVVLQLEHPEIATAPALRTQRFAITVKSGTPPDGLTAAVAERIRSHEGNFEWKTLTVGESEQRHRVLPAVVAGAVVVLLVWAVRRRARRRAT